MENSFKTPDGLRSRYATTDVEEGLTKQQFDDNDDENDDAIIIDVYGNHSVEEDRYHHTNNREGNLSCCDSITQYVPFAPIRNSMVRCKQRCFATTHKGNVSSFRRGIIQQVSSGGVFGCCQVIYNLMMRTNTTRATAVRATYAAVSTPTRSNRRATMIPPSTTMVTSETDEETPPEIEDWTPTPPEPKKPVPSVEVPQLPKLIDYSKSRAKLPDKVPIRIEFCSDWGRDMDDGDDESTTEEDLLLASQGKPTEEKVKFLLRLPNRFPKDDDGEEEVEDDGQQRKKPAIVRTFSNSSRSNIQGLARTLSSELLQKQEGGSLLGQKKPSKENLRDMLKAELQGSSNQGSSSRSSRSSRSNLSINNNNNHSNHHHHESQQATNRNNKMNRRGSGDTTGSTSRNIFIAPFPKPLSRENSLEGLNAMARGAGPSPRTPTSLRSKSLREKEFVRSMLNGTKSNSSFGGSQSERGRYNNGSGDNLLPADTVMLLNDLSGHSDDEKTSGRRRGGGRMNRRGSFVKGSKIERFDGSESQSRMRRALQRREAVKKKQAAAEGGSGGGGAATTTSYAEWKLDLMANG